MTNAALGLGLRGHDLVWSGMAPEAAGVVDVDHVSPGLGVARAHADVVLGGGASPARTASAGWLARAHCMVLSVGGSDVRGWRSLDRWGWDTLYSCGLVDPGEVAAVRAAAPEPVLERLALWSDQEPGNGPDATHGDTEVLERACERALARHRMTGARAAAFLDRDGTLVVERGYLSDPGDLELLPGVPGALKSLRAAGYALVVVSNQSGVARGFFPMSRVYEAMARLRRLLRAHGVELDAVYFCPHRPEAGCRCRKPAPGLLERAAEDLNIALGRSFMVGDKVLDFQTGQAAGGRGILLRTGYGAEESKRLEDAAVERPPDRVCADLAEAAAWIVEEGERLPT
jgi:histidinol-phosphate phosphatase family protein